MQMLFGSAQLAHMHLDADFLWPRDHKIRSRLHDNDFLSRPFSLEELNVRIKEMKNNTAPGLTG
jgi:hypothetical protein